MAPSESSSALVGNPAPAFALDDDQGKSILLGEILQRGPVLLTFYPGDFTPVCTKQLCSYQDSIQKFSQYGVQVVGISKNSPKEHQDFRKAYGFTFPLLSDPDKTVMKAYGVTSLIMLGGTSRAVYVLAKNGTVLYRYVEPTTLTHRKPGELLKVLEFLREKKLI
jgi:peroxiredoxin Q/BCP